MHIAKSTVNRILNVANEIDVNEKLDSIQIDIPNIPEGAPGGIAIEARLTKPTPTVAAPPAIGVPEVLGPEKIL